MRDESTRALLYACNRRKKEEKARRAMYSTKSNGARLSTVAAGGNYASASDGVAAAVDLRGT